MGQSIGLVAETAASRTSQDASNPDDETMNAIDTEMSKTSLPDFVPKYVASQVGRAKRSLELLRSAKPNHPLCHTLPNWQNLCHGWTWTNDGVEDLVQRLGDHVKSVNSMVDDWRQQYSSVRNVESTPTVHRTASGVQRPGKQLFVAEAAEYPPELVQFRVFDLEPGSHIPNAVAEPIVDDYDVNRDGYTSLSYTEFLKAFQHTLPTAAPTLHVLADIACLQPLVAHSRLLSSSLLDLFLSDLDFISHVDLLHQFMLFGDPSFATRIRTSLFIEDEWEEDKSSRRSSSRSRQKRKKRGHTSGEINRDWGVGLNPSLSERGVWPPGGSELAFSLRRVIVDTLDDERIETDEGERKTGGGKQRDAIWNEAEWRLGFMIRYLEEDEEDEGDPSWLDPTCESHTSGICSTADRRLLHYSYRGSRFLGDDV